ncbi:MerR family transcriptional regulator [Streptomyces sp. NPDC004111]|uniref:MerR family transcriptional regulator n=1 Tax=Streptomyces sp. NPDC004111 TaxID=3364690 RepID=UPI0036CA887B
MSDSRRTPLRTVDVAGQTGYSVQQVRDLERLGVLPPAPRAGNGYRSYTPLHVRALHAYRGLAEAAGPGTARRLLAELRTRPLDEAVAAVNAVHAGLAREREETLRAQRALHTIRAEAHTENPGQESPRQPRRPDDTMTITELAEALGVRTSTLRFWEQEGLIAPDRVTSLRARRYDPAAIDAARVVTALRAAGYAIPAVREVMDSLRDAAGQDRAEHLLRTRLDLIATRSLALLRAGADLAALVPAAAPSPQDPPHGP